MALTSFLAASQHGPRPLPLFLELLRRETQDDPDRRAAALAGLAAYQSAKRPRLRPPQPVIAAQGRVRIWDYSLDRNSYGTPTLFIPSLINPAGILDMPYGRSILRWLARRNIRPMLLDWGTPGPEHRSEDIDQLITNYAVPLIERIGQPVVLAGYCLGGTIAAAIAQLAPVRGLAMIAAPWRFDGFSDAARADIAQLWEMAGPISGQLGLLPMEALQSGFWQLDPERTVRKFEKFAHTPAASSAAKSFVALEDWANDGAPLTHAAGKQLFERFFASNLPGTGSWRIDGQRIDPLTLSCPTIEFLSRTDRIVPATSAVGLPDQRLLDLGHVGMMVGSRAQQLLWRPLAQWIETVIPNNI